MKRLICLLFAFLFFQISYSQSYLKDINDINKLSDDVMENLVTQNYQGAFSLLKKYWPLPDNEINQLESATITQLNIAASRFGNIIGKEFIKDQTLNDLIIRKIYVLRFEKHMIRVYFTYYNNNIGWMLNSFKWDDQLDELLN